MLYEFTINYSDGSKSYPIATSSAEFKDQLAYCQTRKKDKLISKWTYKIIKETW